MSSDFATAVTPQQLTYRLAASNLLFVSSYAFLVPHGVFIYAGKPKLLAAIVICGSLYSMAQLGAAPILSAILPFRYHLLASLLLRGAGIIAFLCGKPLLVGASGILLGAAHASFYLYTRSHAGKAENSRRTFFAMTLGMSAAYLIATPAGGLLVSAGKLGYAFLGICAIGLVTASFAVLKGAVDDDVAPTAIGGQQAQDNGSPTTAMCAETPSLAEMFVDGLLLTAFVLPVGLFAAGVPFASAAVGASATFSGAVFGAGAGISILLQLTGSVLNINRVIRLKVLAATSVFLSLVFLASKTPTMVMVTYVLWAAVGGVLQPMLDHHFWSHRQYRPSTVGRFFVLDGLFSGLGPYLAARWFGVI